MGTPIRFDALIDSASAQSDPSKAQMLYREAFAQAPGGPISLERTLTQQ